MGFIQLIHDSRLGYAAKKDLPSLTSSSLQIAENHNLITFRESGKVKPDKIYKNINACSRFLNLPVGDIFFCGIESDSPLAPLILWDVAHTLEVGCSITLLEDSGIVSHLERSYFKHAFSLIQNDGQQKVFRKIAPLLAEQDAGLNRWSFCIPTGPGDATGLNAIVKRILEFNIPEKEIILCGRPDSNFKYWNDVRIVGEDIPAPPVWITRKKNVLAQEARFENLCILHDRVFLPSNFMEAISQFGDYFPFLGFQSLWFDDLLNISPVRYSDFDCFSEDHVANVFAVDKGDKATLFSSSLFAEIEKQNFAKANPLRYQRNTYLTGSLYIVKRRVWLHMPQDEGLYWAEFEDVEQGMRCHTQGIPHRIIPGAFTQSLYARPLLYLAGYTSCFTAKGEIISTRKTLALKTCLLKPLIKISEDDANKRLARFSAKYCSGGFSRFASETDTLTKIISAIYTAQLPFRKSAIIEFLNDLERDVLCDQLGYGIKQWLIEQFIHHHNRAKFNFSSNFKEMISQYSQRPRGKRFYQSLLDYFPKRSWKVKLGSLFSAWRLARVNGNYLYHPKGFQGYYQAILDSTPFIDYAEIES